VKLHLIDSSEQVTAALQMAFAPFPEVTVRHGDLLAVAEHCIVSPANSYGYMDGGFDRVLLDFFGASIQFRVQDVISSRPEGLLPVGASVLVRTGHSRVPFLIVAPTMTLPEHVEPSNAHRAMRAVLRIGRELAGSIFCPGLCTGVGAVSPRDAADAMARAYAESLQVA